MNKPDTKMVVYSAIGLIVFLIIVNPDIRSNMATYLVLGVTVIVGLLMNTTMTVISEEKPRVMKKADGTVELGERERKLLIFYILSELERTETLTMDAIAQDLSVSIYDLNEIVKFLGKHGAVDVIYPPMQNFPILRRGNPEKSKLLRLSIIKAVSKRSLMGATIMEDFTKEVKDYVQGMRRGG